ncbi:hypothetical protein JHD47_08100 [Sulfurimonas sp. SAG-AH-194-L11]|nr:hypothetical protein [Sulfurimonas sp. SAG-AH-194-L11]MDF1877776.1 hypothetical protein [Sulfurimonas sp. SAG-AH-194-L11]
MSILGIGIDYSNICKDYNTSYLDRDNLDPDTKKCMKKVLTWTKEFISELLEKFEYNLYNLSSDTPVDIDKIAAKRFLFYSLEKEITLQSFVIDKEYTEYSSLVDWESQNKTSLLIRNDEDGGSIYFYVDKNPKVREWMLERLSDFSLDEVVFEAK